MGIAAAEAGSIGLATPWAGYNYAGIAAGAPAPIAAAAPAAWATPAIAAAPAWAGAAIAPAPLAINPLDYAGQLYPAAEPYLHDLAGEAYPEAEAYVHDAAGDAAADASPAAEAYLHIEPIAAPLPALAPAPIAAAPAIGYA